MRDLPVGNGSLLVNFDELYQVRDIYFPHVGQENHSEGYPSHLGVWVDGVFSWVQGDGWKRDLRYIENSLITDVTLTNTMLGIELNVNDVVPQDIHDLRNVNALVRVFTVRDLSGKSREVRVFIHHDLRIYENKNGDTAYYDPRTNAIIHYKKHRYFLISTTPRFNEFATGRKAFRESEGTWRDAEDGHLQGGTITEGSVDSTIGVFETLEPNGEFSFNYRFVAGQSYGDAELGNSLLSEHDGNEIIEKCLKFEERDMLGCNVDLSLVSERAAKLFRKSLKITRSQIDKNGAIIAANDHDVTLRATDHYSYVWPRDGAFVADALDRAGFGHYAREFLNFCKHCFDYPHGFLRQKYNPDGSIGSGWHSSWDVVAQKEILPIQEDETALVIWAAGQHYRLAKKQVAPFGMNGGQHVLSDFNGIYERAVDFLIDYRDDDGLPKPSWNLWEDRYGIHTFTCATVVAALRAAAEIAADAGHGEKSARYSTEADRTATAMKQRLYSQELGRFYRAINVGHHGEETPDATIDASMFAVQYFGIVEPDDEMARSTIAAIEEHLLIQGGIGGVARFQHDGYMRGESSAPGNPWPICTLWLAELYIGAAKSIDDLKQANDLIEWVVDRALPSGVLAEQYDPETGEGLSVSPLTWSHSTFIATVISYIDKVTKLRTTND